METLLFSAMEGKKMGSELLLLSLSLSIESTQRNVHKWCTLLSNAFRDDREGFFKYDQWYPLVITLIAALESILTKCIEGREDTRKSPQMKKMEAQFSELVAGGDARRFTPDFLIFLQGAFEIVPELREAVSDFVDRRERQVEMAAQPPPVMPVQEMVPVAADASN
ncbi:unnamed protein product [Cuscuta epithymum]|uniref:Uncharacterized protein n=1 Tax=Cuscuta epithymum TaxID=186058 RepID=A0AAV0C5L3_9ASTE|nr:unnamed protein product [Cuscuta epithymum]CAH9064848.1 unnamed protein product [Cuscuta epithymum]CAH9136350.1 unnamed protein product [Cuscuta epithymum]CAH9136351.1 unnamed protein product [Cuscuta epithymum]